jgi:hypothetical protein
MEMSGQLHDPAALPSGKNHSMHGIGRWVDPRKNMGGFGEEIACPGSEEKYYEEHPCFMHRRIPEYFLVQILNICESLNSNNVFFRKFVGLFLTLRPAEIRL